MYLHRWRRSSPSVGDGGSSLSSAHQTAEMVARSSYGRLLAAICRHTGDIAAAEDALAEAFRAALEQWPTRGVPDSPEAWLHTVARRRAIDEQRRDRVVFDSELLDNFDTGDSLTAGRSGSGGDFHDPRLALLFVCAHPAIRQDCHTPLMLQTVLGLTTERIAALLLVSPAGLRQRLLRAKNKIRQAGIPFVIPPLASAPERLDAVLEAIYGAFASHYSQPEGHVEEIDGLAEEAIFLATLIADLLPEAPEAHGLAALLCLIHSRRPARANKGKYVPLEGQDEQLWDRTLYDKARMHLRVAAEARSVERFQLEAAIQLAHMARMEGREVNWSNIAALYADLRRLAPTLGSRVSEAAAVARASLPRQGLALLDEMDPGLVAAFQPYWCVRAHLLAESGDLPGASQAYTRAIGLTADPALRKFLIEKARPLPEGGQASSSA